MTLRIGMGRRLLFVVAAVALSSGSVSAEEWIDAMVPAASYSAASATLAPAASAVASAPADPTPSPSTISGNLAAVNIVAGTGKLGSALGLDPDSGVRVGGVWVGNANVLLTGGEKSAQSSFNSLLLADLNLDLAKLANIPGAQFGAQFLQFNGQPSNEEAGTVTGYNGLQGQFPLVRSELYQFWWRQSLFDEKLVIRIGKSVPTYDFNNVGRPVQTRVQALEIPSVTGLIYTPAFKNTTLIGAMPGYYNSAYGITTTIAPTERLYVSFGAYDDSDEHQQTGLSTGPLFNGNYFYVAETGYAWVLDSGTLPGGVAVGGWRRTGKLEIPNTEITDNGADGFYTFGSQRLWNSGSADHATGVSGFYQFGVNDSHTLLAHRYFGVGATGFGLIPNRPSDTVGIGLAWSWLNPGRGFRSDETILATYYQAKILDNLFVQPVLTFVPNPGASPSHAASTALTLQTTILF
jgi:porin